MSLKIRGNEVHLHGGEWVLCCTIATWTAVVGVGLLFVDSLELFFLDSIVGGVIFLAFAAGTGYLTLTSAVSPSGVWMKVFKILPTPVGTHHDGRTKYTFLDFVETTEEWDPHAFTSSTKYRLPGSSEFYKLPSF